MSSNKLTALNLSGLDNLVYLDASDNQIESLSELEGWLSNHGRSGDLSGNPGYSGDDVYTPNPDQTPNIDEDNLEESKPEGDPIAGDSTDNDNPSAGKEEGAGDGSSDASRETEDPEIESDNTSDKADDANGISSLDSFGFFEHVGAEDAIEILESCKYASYTQKGDPDDATNMANVLATMDLIREGNALRALHGAGELLITHELMAMAQANANYSDTIIAHSSQFRSYGTGENLAWNHDGDPYYQWYTQEKRNYEANNGGEVGHYFNLISHHYTATGFAICTRGTLRSWWDTYSQTFHEKIGTSEAYTVDEYEKMLLDYCNEALS